MLPETSTPVLQIRPDGLATLAELLEINRNISKGLSLGCAMLERLFHPPSPGLFCRSDVLENVSSVFENHSSVFELSSSRVFCLVMYQGRTLEAVGESLLAPGHRIECGGVDLKEEVAGSKAVGEERKAVGAP
jgi:hypothetical protein